MKEKREREKVIDSRVLDVSKERTRWKKNGDNVDDKGESLVSDTVLDVSEKPVVLCDKELLVATVLQTGGTVDVTCYVRMADREPSITDGLVSGSNGLVDTMMLGVSRGIGKVFVPELVIFEGVLFVDTTGERENKCGINDIIS